MSSPTGTGISKLLEEQYAATERYCNTQTALRNIVVSRQDGSRSKNRNLKLSQALRDHEEAVERVHSNLQALHQHEAAPLKQAEETPQFPCAALAKVLSEHVKRSRRVLQTIHREGAYHPNGIPLPTENTSATSTMLVALSTLRASIQVVQEHVQYADDES